MISFVAAMVVLGVRRLSIPSSSFSLKRPQAFPGGPSTWRGRESNDSGDPFMVIEFCNAIVDLCVSARLIMNSLNISHRFVDVFSCLVGASLFPRDCKSFSAAKVVFPIFASWEQLG